MLLLLITMTFSDQNFYIYSRTNIYQYHRYYAELRMKSGSWRMKLLGFILESEIYSQEFARSLEICKAQKDNSGVRWHIIKQTVSNFSQAAGCTPTTHRNLHLNSSS